MPSNYTGDLSAIQSPSAPPGTFISPTFALPADGDDLDAASVEQPWKESADRLDYVEKWIIWDEFTGSAADTGRWVVTGSPATSTVSGRMGIITFVADTEALNTLGLALGTNKFSYSGIVKATRTGSSATPAIFGIDGRTAAEAVYFYVDAASANWFIKVGAAG